MPKKVIKKDGTEEEFDRQKVLDSTMKAGAPAEDAHEIADAVEDIPADEVHTSEIRMKVLEEFRGRYRVFEMAQVIEFHQILQLYSICARSKIQMHNNTGI